MSKPRSSTSIDHRAQVAITQCVNVNGMGQDGPQAHRVHRHGLRPRVEEQLHDALLDLGVARELLHDAVEGGAGGADGVAEGELHQRMPASTAVRVYASG